ncbi:MAG: PCI domain-containing protein [Ignavibacteria bacterium]|nr:PCI domain-containing protein [Ignavibacteria bacterium]
MNSKEILEIISAGESSTVEFKRKISSDVKIAKEIAAFANTLGGWLIIGVDDNGTVIGVESEKADVDEIKKICGFFIEPTIEPKIEIIQIFRLDIIAIYIEKSAYRPHKVKEIPDDSKSKATAYIRVGAKSIAASSEYTKVLAGQNINSKPITISIGDRERRLFNYLELYERATVKDFARLVNISKRRSERILVQLVRAGVLQIHIDSEEDYFTHIS